MVVKVAMPQQFKLKVVPSLKGLLFPNQKEVHYIGGSEVLPPPLETERETEVIRRLGSEYDQEAKKMLIEHNLRLVVYIAKKFDNTGVGVEDLISIGTIGLIKAINTFNPTKKIKLATYASRCIENEILMYLRRNSKTKMEVSIDEPLNVDWDCCLISSEQRRIPSIGIWKRKRRESFWCVPSTSYPVGKSSLLRCVLVWIIQMESKKLRKK